MIDEGWGMSKGLYRVTMTTTVSERGRSIGSLSMVGRPTCPNLSSATESGGQTPGAVAVKYYFPLHSRVSLPKKSSSSARGVGRGGQGELWAQSEMFGATTRCRLSVVTAATDAVSRSSSGGMLCSTSPLFVSPFDPTFPCCWLLFAFGPFTAAATLFWNFPVLRFQIPARTNKRRPRRRRSTKSDQPQRIDNKRFRRYSSIYL